MCRRLLPCTRQLSATRQFTVGAIPAVDVVVCGAGVAGVACAHYLARTHGARVLLVDQRPALSYTSALSTECYRNYWSDHGPMTTFMNQSIDLLEERATECDNAFSMNRRGYCFLSRLEQGASRHLAAASAVQQLGLGETSVHTRAVDAAAAYRHDRTFDDPTAGLSVYSGKEAVESFLKPLGDFVSPDVISIMHCERGGWMNAQ